jgi:dephospho-CoA kinase
MLSIALTGGIGSGKSLAGEFFAELGAIVIDSDQLAREVIERGRPGYDEVVARFGDEILDAGEIDRSKLASIIFSDSSARKDLEAIIHPKVRDAAARIVARAGEGAVVINQIPLLFESNGAKRFDLVITVAATPENRKARLLARGLKGYEIDARIAAQASEEERASIADFILNNDGSESDLERAVTELWEREIRPRLQK